MGRTGVSKEYQERHPATDPTCTIPPPNEEGRMAASFPAVMYTELHTTETVQYVEEPEERNNTPPDSLDQRWANYGPRAACGPLKVFMRTAS